MLPNYVNKIKSHSQTPPQQVWLNIVNELNKEEENSFSDFKTKALSNQKLLFYKEKESLNFTKKMYNYQIEPPAKVWKGVVSTLYPVQNKVVPLLFTKKKIPSFYLRLSAAAAVVFLVSIAILQSLKNTNNNAVVADAKSVNRFQNNTTTTVPENTTTVAEIKNNVISKKATTTGTISTINPTPTSVTAPQEPLYVKGEETTDLAYNSTSEIFKEKLQNANGDITTDIALMNTPNTYLSVMGPDGQTVKVSSKFSNLLGYLLDKKSDAQENLDIIISQSAEWRNKIAVWRNNMTHNSVAPSAFNFFDIIELSKVVESHK